MKRARRGVITLAVGIIAAMPAAQGQYAKLDSATIQQIAAMLPANPAGVGVPCTNRVTWKPLAGRFNREIAEAEVLLKAPFPAWSDDAYLDYSRTGSRQQGEKMLHARQDELMPLVLAECVEGRGRFVERIALVLDGLATQKSWTLPAHDVKLDSFTGRRYFVELNSADLAHTIAETLYLMGDWLPQATRVRAMDALQKRIFAPMRASYENDKGQSWLHVKSNWNAVCLKGVTGAALAVLPDRKDRALFVAGAKYYINYYRMGFGDDGYASEGMGYWNYGFSHYAEMREDLLRATKGKIDLFSDPKMRKVALFGAQFPMLPGNAADFGDAHFMVRPDGNLMSYINQVFNLGLKEDTSEATHAHASLTWLMMQDFPNPASQIHNATGSGKFGVSLIGLRTYYPDAGVLVSRPDVGGRLAVTIKAGGNTSHSHDDIGSFAIGLGATQPVGDPGGPSYYTSQTFSKDRLQSRLINSFGHPVPVIDGKLQLDATHVHAPVLRRSFTQSQDSISIDMSSAYDSPHLRRLTRTMVYRRQGTGSVKIEDSFDLTAPTEIEEALPTHGTWSRLDAQTLLFTAKNERLRVLIDAPGGFNVVQERINEYGNPFTLVGLHITMKRSGKVKLLFVPE
ncbi:MAG TPA: hypothetical protein VFE38_11530 [Edaphobacter sp.]|nr:hypothetical protein [Edaphobacter sp.]